MTLRFLPHRLARIGGPFVLLAVLFTAACGGPGGETGKDDGFDLCGYLDDHTPTDVPDADAVTVYCQTTTDCSASERRITTEAVLADAEVACGESDELAEWSRLDGECDAGAAVAVRCWRLD